MTTEEKAKKYDEALEWMRKVYPTLTGATKEDAEHYFPELKKSESDSDNEDERVRKAILAFIKLSEGTRKLPTREYSKWIEYLEKQKNTISYYEEKLDKCVCENFNKGIREVLLHPEGYGLVKQGQQEEPQVYKTKDGETITYSESDGYKVCEEKQKEQKPSESISHLTVQGKGVYKICPRCKERMVRDDSKVYTSMPPQYGYECPKCGEIEFDTTMYDNPEMEENKPAEWSKNDTVFLNEITDYFENKTVRLQHDLDMYAHWLKTLPGRFNLQPKKEWSEDIIRRGIKEVGLTQHQIDWLKSNVVPPKREQKPAEWSEEDKERIQSILFSIGYCKDEYPNKKDYSKDIDWLKSLQPQPKQKDEYKHTGWVARDKEYNSDSGLGLVLFKEKPRRSCDSWSGAIASLQLAWEAFPDLKWEDEPMEVEITITKK